MVGDLLSTQDIENALVRLLAASRGDVDDLMCENMRLGVELISARREAARLRERLSKITRWSAQETITVDNSLEDIQIEQLKKRALQHMAIKLVDCILQRPDIANISIHNSSNKHYNIRMFIDFLPSYGDNNDVITK
jgi:hypothetical protein